MGFQELLAALLGRQSRVALFFRGDGRQLLHPQVVEQLAKCGHVTDRSQLIQTLGVRLVRNQISHSAAPRVVKFQYRKLALQTLATFLKWDGTPSGLELPFFTILQSGSVSFATIY